MSKTLAEIYAELENVKTILKDRVKGYEAKGVIHDILLGTVKEFLPEEALEKWKGDLDVQCMQVIITTPDGNNINRIFTFSAHKNSNLQKYFKRYKKYPEINDKVDLGFDGNFWQLEVL